MLFACALVLVLTFLPNKQVHEKPVDSDKKAGNPSFLILEWKIEQGFGRG
jgi:hypothetical protein